MGLDINNYSASYSQIHRLRSFALEVEKNKLKLSCQDYNKMEDCGKCVYCKLNKAKSVKDQSKITKFYEFVNHSDCEGGYISFKKFGVNKKRSVEWGDLDVLKKEVEELDKHSGQLKDFDLESWNDFYEDVIDEDAILLFK